MSFFTKQQLQDNLVSLKNGAVFAYPTDTVWGLGSLPDNELACKRIYEIKKRDGQKPLILLGAKIEDFNPYIDNFPPLAKDLAEKYWPGALTIIVKKSPKLSEFVTSEMDTVGLRIPNHPILLELLQTTGAIATTSANLSGEPAAINLEQTQSYVGDKVDFILGDFGIPAQGKESTVVLVQDDTFKVLRQGAIKIEG